MMNLDYETRYQMFDYYSKKRDAYALIYDTFQTDNSYEQMKIYGWLARYYANSLNE